MRTLISPLLALLFGWAGLHAPDALAASGAIGATPATVVMANPGDVGNTRIGWTASGGTQFYVTVACNGGSDGVFASSGAGSYTQDAPWITVGSTCAFRLRSTSSTGAVLATVTVAGVTASGTITASPATVVIPTGQSTGTTNVQWTGNDGSTFYVTANCGSGEQLFASSGAGSYQQSAPWITVGTNCLFRLRAGTPTGRQLAQVTVTGVSGQLPSGSLSASPGTVLVPAGQTYGSSTIAWNTAYVSQAYVMASCNGGAQTVFATSAVGSSSKVATNIPAGGNCTYQLRANGSAGTLLASTTVTGQRLITAQRGGSNHLYYKVPPAGSGDSAYNYGIMLHYHEAGVRSTVRAQLQQMYANGQRSLRVLVHYAHSPGGTFTTTPAESSRKCRVSTSPCPAGSEYFLPLQYQQNLRDYLADIRAAGFERVMIAMGPQWINDFYACNSTNVPLSLRQQLYAGSPLVNELFEEAWGVAKELRGIAVSSGLPYLIDLGNEYIPPSNIANFGQCAKDILEGTSTSSGYLRFLWGRYVGAYGTQDTVGFSVIVGNAWDADNRLARMPLFLSPLPSTYSLHSYTSSGNITAGLNRAYVVTGNFGRRPWIIGETDNRSTASADAIRSFILATPQQSVLHVMQWPGFNCSSNETCLPLDFSAFITRGF